MKRRMISVARSILGLLAVVILVIAALGPAVAGLPPSSEATSQKVQVEIYEAVLQSWLGVHHSRTLVDQRLSSAPKIMDPSVTACLKGIDFQPAVRVAPALRSLRHMHIGRKGIRIIDGAKWHSADEPLMAHLNDGGPNKPNQNLSRAMAHSLMSFSKIQFDRTDHWALLSFSSACGALCGTGSTYLMHERNDTWKVFRRCGGWVS